MGRIARSFFITEVILSFAPVVLFLISLIPLIPIWLHTITVEPARLLDRSNILFPGAVILGVLGLVALANVVAQIINPSYKAIRPGLALTFAVLGLISIIPLAFDSFFGPLRWIFIVPIVVSIHIIYLGRDYLFGSDKPRKDREI